MVNYMIMVSRTLIAYNNWQPTYIVEREYVEPITNHNDLFLSYN